MSFEMYTPAGDRACQAQLNKIVKFIQSGKGVTPDAINALYDNALNKIKLKHPEVMDTEPSWHLKDRIRKCLTTNFYDKSKFI